ncbi:MAG: nitroreductase family protein [Bacteroidaceae bacterium]|nr:nitroreductase family protein [Bacteroidaceae bacterium]
MDNFSTLIANRRSMRKFTEQKLDQEQKRLILRSALIAPSSKNTRSWEFITVEDRDMLQKLSVARESGSGFLAECAWAVVVVADKSKTDCWIEDCSIAATFMQLQAQDLGLGSCWTQMRGRSLADGTPSDKVLAGLLGIPEGFEPLCIIGFGYKNQERKPYEDEKIEWAKIHSEKF